MVEGTPNLTRAFDDRMQVLMDKTPAGMAHWAGTGPEGATCRECVFYQSPGHYAHTNRLLAGLLRDGKCAKFRRMTGKAGPAFRPQVECCRFLNETNLRRRFGRKQTHESSAGRPAREAT